MPEVIVTFQLDPLGDGVRLTLTNGFYEEPIEGKFFEAGCRGWPIILSGLKSLLETGRALPEFDWSA